MSLNTSIAFAGQLGTPALIFGGQRFFRLQAFAFPGTALTVSVGLQSGASGPLLFYGNRDEGSVQSSQTTYCSITVGNTTVVEVQGAQLSFDTRQLSQAGWHRLAITIQITPGTGQLQAQAFINGVALGPVQSAQPEVQGHVLAMNNVLMLGAHPADSGSDNQSVPSGYIQGGMRDCRVWAGVLSPALISQESNQTISGGEANLYLAWPLASSYLDVATSLALDLTPAKRNADWVAIFDSSPSFAQSEKLAFPVGTRTVQMWVLGGRGTLLSYGLVSSSSESGSVPWRIEASEVGASDGRWHHLTVVLDQEKQTSITYIDGKAKPAVSISIDPLQPNLLMLLGAQWATDANDSIFTGQLRDVKIWSIARSAKQIANDAAGLLPWRSKGLVAHWPLEPDAPGTDVSGHGYHLSFTYSRATLGLAFNNPTPGLFQTDITVDGRPAHVIVAKLDNLVIAGQASASAPAGTVVVPANRDLLVYATQVSIFGTIKLPGQRIEIVANRVDAIANSAAELNTDAPPAVTNPPIANYGTSPASLGSGQDVIARLPVSKDDFNNHGGHIDWITPKQPIDPADDDYFAMVASYWSQPIGNTGKWTPAKIANSGGAGLRGALPTPAGLSAAPAGLPSIRLICRHGPRQSLILSAQGGIGPPGQSGQVGGNADGGATTVRPYQVDQMMYAEPFPMWGGVGGKGGDAATGGNGGAGGLIETAVLLPRADVAPFITRVGGGAPGGNGTPGAGGKGGQGGLLNWANNLNMRLPSSPDGAAGSLSGTPGQRGAEGTVVTQSLAQIDAKALLRQRTFLALLDANDNMASNTYSTAAALAGLPDLPPTARKV
jgi:Concanavalin A-like lectin/glucanases superfamily